MQTINPGKGQIFAKPDEAETQTKSGFYLDTKAAEKPRTAQVINVGEDVTFYQAKDTIVYKAYAPTEIKLEGVEYIIVAAEDVLGKVINQQD